MTHLGQSGPFDPDELVRWAENYGHPEEWAKKAQQLHFENERLRSLVHAERVWHVYGRDGFGDPPDVDYWTEDESQARVARNAGHKVDEYVRADRMEAADAD